MISNEFNMLKKLGYVLISNISSLKILSLVLSTFFGFHVAYTNWHCLPKIYKITNFKLSQNPNHSNVTYLTTRQKYNAIFYFYSVCLNKLFYLTFETFNFATRIA